jgi:hypothetical protein
MEQKNRVIENSQKQYIIENQNTMLVQEMADNLGLSFDQVYDFMRWDIPLSDYAKE